MTAGSAETMSWRFGQPVSVVVHSRSMVSCSEIIQTSEVSPGRSEGCDAVWSPVAKLGPGLTAQSRQTQAAAQRDARQILCRVHFRAWSLVVRRGLVKAVP